MKILAIGGLPGTGKTALVRRYIGRMGEGHDFKFGLLRGHMFGPVAVLGLYGEGVGVFGGTDRLSMAVQPDAEKFLQAHSKAKGACVVFEGDRLFKPSFLGECHDVGMLQIWLITAMQVLRLRRIDDRGTKPQDESWVKGRQTNINNICAKFDCKDWRNDDLSDLNMLVDRMVDFTGHPMIARTPHDRSKLNEVADV